MILTTRRLILREFEEEDWRAVLAYQSDPLYLRYNPWTERNELDVRSFVRMFISWREENPRSKFQFALLLLPELRLIGNCGIRINEKRNWEADIGYEVASNYWGHGYATEAARQLLVFGFRDLKLHRIYAQCIAENTASARVMEKIGMRYEGRLRQYEWMKERWWDTLQFSILDSEWQALTLNSISK